MIDFTKVKSYGGFYTEQVNLRNYIMKICFYAVTFYLYKVVYFFKHIFRNDPFIEDLNPVIGIWVTRELEEGFVDPSYADELDKVKDWTEQIIARSIPKSNILLSRGRCDCAELFYECAPESIK